MSPTKTANKTAYLPNALHLLGPFTDLTPTWTEQPVIATSTSAPRPPQNYPYGPAPLPPLPSEPLGLDSTPSFYGPGISILFLCISLAAVLQLFLPGYPFSSGPFSSWLLPSERQLTKKPKDAASLESGSPVEVKYTKVDVGGGDDDDNARSEALQRRKNLLSHHLPLHALQIVTLLGMNLLAKDLLSKQSRLDQFSYHPVPTSNSTDDGSSSGSDDSDHNNMAMAPWIPIAASLGPPLTLLYWSVFLMIFHFLISLFRWDRPPKELERRNETEAKTAANHNMVISMLGLLFPCAVLAIMGTKTWAWLPMERTDYSPRDHFSKLYPSDFMPALYVDGMDDGLHAVFLMTAATVGAWVIVTPCFVLLMSFFSNDLLLGKFVKNSRAARRLKTGLKYLAFVWIGSQTVAFGASFVLSAIGGLMMLVTWGRSGLVVMEWASFAMMFFAWSALSLMMPLLVPFVGVPLFLSFWTVGVLGWYGWKVLTTGGAIVGRSCLFIPCSEASVWRPDQLALAAMGAGLVVYVYLLMKESPLLAAGGGAKGKKGH